MARTSIFSETYIRGVLQGLSAGKRRFLDVTMVCLVAIGTFMIYVVFALVGDVIEIRRLIATGRETSAKIVTLELDRSPRRASSTYLTYSFKAHDGRSYTGSASRSGTQSFQDATDVAILYDPDNPQISTVLYDIERVLFERIVVAPFLIVAIVFASVFLPYRYFSARRTLSTVSR